MKCAAAILLLASSLVAFAEDDRRVMCHVVNTAFYERQGWQPLQDTDRARVENIRRAGKAEIGFLPGSLICVVWINGEQKRVDTAGLWYWRRK